MRRWLLATVCAALAVLAVTGALYVVSDAGPSHPRPSATTPPVLRQRPLADLDGAGIPSASGVTAALGHALSAPVFGGSLAGLVVDARTGRVLFAREPAAAFAPASTAKLLTATAALSTLGPRAQLSTTVVRSGRTLYLVGGGDVTLASGRRPGYPPLATLPDLARRTAAALGPAGGSYRLRYDVSAWTGLDSAPGWNPGYFTAGDVSHLSPLEVDEGRLRPAAVARWSDPAGQAAAAFAAALRADGVRLAGSPLPGTAPTRAAVAVVRSPPLAALVQRMLTRSDNDLAESLGRAVAVRAGQPATFAGAAAAVTAAVSRLGLPMAGVHLYDASGLSHLDRVTPRTLVAVLRLVTTSPRLQAIDVGLPVAGLTGTLADRYRHGRQRTAAGEVRAKTGTLAGVSALAGQVVDADGRLLLFTFLTGHAGLPSATETALDALATRLAGCGCR